MQIYSGGPYPLGATWNGRGVDVAVFSDNAGGIDLCLFDDARDTSESARYRRDAGPTRLAFPMPPRLAELDVQVVVDTVALYPAGTRSSDHYQLPAHSCAVILVGRPADT